MKTTLNSFVLGFFLFLCSTTYAQVTIDNQERVLFGSRAFANGLSIADERTGAVTVGVPFRIIRTLNASTNDNVYFTRSASSLSSGLVMFSNGNWTS